MILTHFDGVVQDWGISNAWVIDVLQSSWWRHQMETFSTLLAICAGNSPVTGEFSTQRPVTQSFDVFFDLRLNRIRVNSCEAGDLRRQRTHYDVTVMYTRPLIYRLNDGFLLLTYDNSDSSLLSSTKDILSCTSVFRQDTLWYGAVRPSVHPSVRSSVRPVVST